MSHLTFMKEVIDCQKAVDGDSVVQEQSFSIPNDVVLDGIDLIATVQAPA